MKKVRVEDAVGMTLCHDVTAMRAGFKGVGFPRGHVIAPEDIPKFLDYGKRHIFVWEPNADELHEEDAAKRLAAMAPVPGAHYTKPSEGKVLLIADIDGMFRVDTALLHRINAIGDITVCSLPDHYPVKKGMPLASMRIVPLVIPEQQIADAESQCAGSPLFSLFPYRYLRAALIITGSELYTGRVPDLFEPVARKKLSAYPCEIIGVTIADDCAEQIRNAILLARDRGAELIVLSGGMSVDPDDVTPEAIAMAGAEIVRFGVPSQPGNMTLVAYLGQTAILGVPGAAVVLPTTLFDALLPQVFAGQRFSREDLTRLGDGGLCQKCKDCHFPNCTFGRY